MKNSMKKQNRTRSALWAILAVGTMVTPALAYDFIPGDIFDRPGTFIGPPTMHTVQEESVPPGGLPSTWTPADYQGLDIDFNVIKEIGSVGETSVYELVSAGQPAAKDLAVAITLNGVTDDAAGQSGGFAYGVPSPGALGVLGIAALLGRRRRR